MAAAFAVVLPGRAHAGRATRRRTRSWPRTACRATRRASGTSAAPATPSIQGFATDISVNRGEHGRLQDRHRRRPTTASTSTAWATTAASARARSRRSSRRRALPQTQPACLTRRRRPASSTAATGRVSASWAVPANAGLGHLLRQARARGRRRRARATSSSSSATTAAARDLLFQTSDTTWQAYNQLRRQQPLHRRARPAAPTR